MVIDSANTVKHVAVDAQLRVAGSDGAAARQASLARAAKEVVSPPTKGGEVRQRWGGKRE